MTDELLRAYGIYTHRIPMPARIRGYVQKREDYYLIYLNDKLGDAASWSTLEHELRHIAWDDFSLALPVAEIEKRQPG